MVLVTLVILGLGLALVLYPSAHGAEDWAIVGFILLEIFFGAPMLLAALAVLVGGTKAAILGGAISLLGAAAVAPFLLLPDIGLMVLVFALFAAAYACAGLAALKTRHARDKAITIPVGPG